MSLRTLLGLLCLSICAFAQTSAEPATAPPALSAGDNAWVLISAALVLMMTGPGLALFYCGLVRRRNVLGTMHATEVIPIICPEITADAAAHLAAFATN